MADRLAEISNRVNELEKNGGKLTAQDFKMLVITIKDELTEQKSLVEAGKQSVSDVDTKIKKMIDDLNVKFQNFLENATVFSQQQQETKMTDREIAGKTLGAMYRRHYGRSKNPAADMKMIMQYGGFVNDVGGDDWKEGNDRLIAIKGMPTDEEIKALVGTPLRSDAATGQYLAPQAYTNEIWRIAQAASMISPVITHIPMINRKITLPRQVANMSFTKVTNQITAKTETNPTFTTFDLDANTYAAWMTLTEELMEDSQIELVGFFSKLFGEAWGVTFDNETINDASYGLLTVSGTVAMAMPTGKTDGSAVSWTDMNNMQTQIPVSVRAGAGYIMHSETFNVVCNMHNAQGDPIYRQPWNPTTPATINGKPYWICDAMPALSDQTAGKPVMAYGNPANMVSGDRIGMEIKFFNQTIQAVQYDQVFLRARIRKAQNVALPGAFCILSTAAA